MVPDLLHGGITLEKSKCPSVILTVSQVNTRLAQQKATHVNCINLGSSYNNVSTKL